MLAAVRRSPPRHLALFVLTFAFVALFARGAAAAPPGFAVNEFDPAERGSRWFALESLDFRGHMRWAVGATLDYELRPLAIYDGNGDVRAAVVDHVFTTHVGGSFVLWERLRFGLNVPVVLYTTGDQGTYRDVVYDAPHHSTVMGDVRLGADVRLYGRVDSPITVAAGAQVFLPSGDASSYAGDGQVRVAPRVLAAGTLRGILYAAKLGVMIRSPEQSTFGNSPIGHELLYGVSAGYGLMDKKLSLGPEIFGSTVLTGSTFKTRTRSVRREGSRAATCAS
jgi:hypothetical protein